MVRRAYVVFSGLSGVSIQVDGVSLLLMNIIDLYMEMCLVCYPRLVMGVYVSPSDTASVLVTDLRS